MTRITRRTAERLHRAAYEYEYLAASLRAEGWASEAEGVKEVSRRLGAIARNMDERFNKPRGPACGFT